jgi:hypothetical protein
MKITNYIQQNSVNVISCNSEILIIWHMRRVVPGPEVWIFTKENSSVKQADLSDMFKKTSNCVCTLTVVESPDPYSRKHRSEP